MGLCGSRCFLLRESFRVGAEGVKEGIAGGGADDGNALGR